MVIPAYNEEENIRRGTLQQVVDFLAARPYVSELLVVDDGSEDDTPRLIESMAPAVTLVRNPHGGKAAAVRTGMLTAVGRYVIFMDMDLATPVTYVDECLAHLEAGSDIVIASREAPGSKRLGDPLTRKVAARVFHFLARHLVLPGIGDSQCGFKGFRREVARDLFGSLLLFGESEGTVSGPSVTAFDVEVLVLARKRGYRIKEMPVTWRHLESRRVSVVKDSARMFVQLLRVWLNERQGEYDAAPGAEQDRRA